MENIIEWSGKQTTTLTCTARIQRIKMYRNNALRPNTHWTNFTLLYVKYSTDNAIQKSRFSKNVTNFKTTENWNDECLLLYCKTTTESY